VFAGRGALPSLPTKIYKKGGSLDWVAGDIF
jgi:hypothetical protein